MAGVPVNFVQFNATNLAHSPGVPGIALMLRRVRQQNARPRQGFGVETGEINGHSAPLAVKRGQSGIILERFARIIGEVQSCWYSQAQDTAAPEIQPKA